MKKTIIVLVAMLVSSIVAKAWEVGDFYAQDPTGVPAVVVYVDESGEHGLIMSPIAMTEKTYQNYIKKKTFDKNKKRYDKQVVKTYKKQGLDLVEIDAKIAKNNNIYSHIIEWYANAPRLFDGNLTEFNERKAIEDIASQNSEYGEENQKAIVAYCEESNFDMEKYFRQNYWAEQLGEGWFIPGNYELELYSQCYAQGFGKQYKPFSVVPKEAIEKLTNFWTKLWGYTGGTDLFPYNMILSSTMIKSAWSEDKENENKITKIVTNGGVGGLIGMANTIATAADKDNYYILLYDMQKGGFSVFISNAQQESSIVAFKRF